MKYINIMQSFRRVSKQSVLIAHQLCRARPLAVPHRSWKKFVRLYYVDEIVCNDSALTITITMTVDRDLRLQFSDRGQ